MKSEVERRNDADVRYVSLIALTVFRSISEGSKDEVEDEVKCTSAKTGSPRFSISFNANASIETIFSLALSISLSLSNSSEDVDVEKLRPLRFDKAVDDMHGIERCLLLLVLLLLPTNVEYGDDDNVTTYRRNNIENVEFLSKSLFFFFSNF